LGPEEIGQDFWYTRNHHGSGFWDKRELEQEQKEKLTQISHSLKGKYDYIGDDGKIYIQ
jgi:hypothetical protein